MTGPRKTDERTSPFQCRNEPLRLPGRDACPRLPVIRQTRPAKHPREDRAKEGPKVQLQSATTGIAGGMRKAPKRGRGGLFVRETAKQLLASEPVANRPNGWLPLVQRPTVVGLTASQGLPDVNVDPCQPKRTPPPAAIVYRDLIAVTQRQRSSDSRRKRRSLVNSHRQSRWLNTELDHELISPRHAGRLLRRQTADRPARLLGQHPHIRIGIRCRCGWEPPLELR